MHLYGNAWFSGGGGSFFFFLISTMLATHRHLNILLYKSIHLIPFGKFNTGVVHELMTWAI